jgi:site-specific DNA-methyltransferase (adenine-specific)
MVKLIHGDCLEEMDKLIGEGVKVDAIITDPPYGTTACKWDSVIPFEPMWERLNKLIKPNGAIVLFGIEPFSSHLRLSNIKMFKYDWVWIKNQPVGMASAKYQPMRDSEIISVFYKLPPLYNKQRTESKIKDRNLGKSNGKLWKKVSEHNGMIPDKSKNNPNNILKKYVNPRTTLFFDVHPRSKGMSHPTQKPVSLLEYLIKTYTIENETVLDFTMGSGTTGVACVNTNRNFIGIELDENYFKVSLKRINPEAFGQRK